MKRLLALAILAFLSFASASMTDKAVLKECDGPNPVPNPGWQDSFGFKPDGKIRRNGNVYSIHGVLFGELGTCFIGEKYKYASFTSITTL